MDNEKHQRFAELFVRNQASVYRYIVSIVVNRADADEVFQQTGLTLWKIWDRYDASRNFLSWAFGVAQNEVRRFIRDRQNRPRLLSDDLMVELTETRLKNQETMNERQNALTDCLERLAPKHRELIELCYGQGRSMKAVADGRGKTPEAIYKAVQRVREMLFDCVGRSVPLGAD